MIFYAADFALQDEGTQPPRNTFLNSLKKGPYPCPSLVIRLGCDTNYKLRHTVGTSGPAFYARPCTL